MINTNLTWKGPLETNRRKKKKNQTIVCLRSNATNVSLIYPISKVIAAIKIHKRVSFVASITH